MNLGRKLVLPTPSLSEAYDPEKAPTYSGFGAGEDPDVSSTLKSAHLAEFIHGVNGAGSSHHNNFYMD